MEKLMNKINFIGGIILILPYKLLGQLWFLFLALLIMNYLDWISGWYCAYKNKKSSSKIGAYGIIKKVGYWCVIGIAFFIGYAFQKMGDILGIQLSFMSGIGWFVLANYLVNEIRSFLENLHKLGIPIPQFLVKGLEIASNLIDNSADSKLNKK